MSVVPYALRPRAVVRKAALKRGVEGGSVFWRALAVYFVGGQTLLRTNALRRGLFGGNRKWQAVGVLMLLTNDVRKKVSKQPESLGTWKVGADSFVNVIAASPMSKKDRKRLGITRDRVIAQAVADTAAAVPDARIVVKTK
jgi:hypothetical protein